MNAPTVQLPFAIIDAFTDRAFAGNPAAVFADFEEREAAAMQGIATRIGLAETVFTMPSTAATLRARYFTPREELAMAGHPSIALAHDLCERSVVEIGTTITLETKAGIIPISIGLRGERVDYTMQQRPPEFGTVWDRREIAAALGLRAADLTVPPQIVSTGNPMLLVPLSDADALARIHPDRDRLFARADGAFVAVHCFCRDDDAPFAFVCRNIGPPGDLPEDAATGSGIGPMAAFVFANRHISHPTFLVSQGTHIGRPSEIAVHILGTPDAIEGIRVGGSAVTSLRASLTL